MAKFNIVIEGDTDNFNNLFLHSTLKDFSLINLLLDKIKDGIIKAKIEPSSRLVLAQGIIPTPSQEPSK